MVEEQKRGPGRPKGAVNKVPPVKRVNTGMSIKQEALDELKRRGEAAGGVGIGIVIERWLGFTD